MSLRSEIRALTRGAYDLQKLRVATGLRVVANYKVKLGQEPSESESDLDSAAQQALVEMRSKTPRITDAVVAQVPNPAEKKPKELDNKALKLLRELRETHARITEAMGKRMPKVFPGEGLISEYSEYSMVTSYINLLNAEDQAFKDLRRVVSKHPIWPWICTVKGCAEAMTGVIISEIDIHEAVKVSNIWKYVGLDVLLVEGEDGVLRGEGRCRKAHHLVMRPYIDKDNNPAERLSITFNAFAKTKLVGVLSGCLMMANDHYAEVYRNYKNRIVNMPAHQDKSDLHIHNMAKRYMIKIFLQDLYNEWRAVENLPIAPTYHEAILGHVHGAGGSNYPQQTPVKTTPRKGKSKDVATA